ncbi:agrocinopine synthase [Agrobacterium rhizogenes]|nr:agrocinopine synthase [Rhizobium rhizogenes]
MFNLGKGVQECTKTSLLTAVGKFGQRNLVELDAALTSDDLPIASHDFNLWRVTSQIDKLVREMHSQDVLNAPVIIREVLNAKISNCHSVTNDRVMSVEQLMDKAFSQNSSATIFLDCREFEAHIIVAWLSHRPRYYQKVILVFYTFRYHDGDHFVRMIEQANPAPGWRKVVAVMPMIFPNELARLANELNLNQDREEDLFIAGKIWLDSILAQSIRVVAVQILMARITYDQLGDTADPQVVRAFMADHAAVRLALYIKEDPAVRERHPHLKLATLTRCYDFSAELKNGERAEFGNSFLEGREERRETDERRYIRDGYGKPGNAAALADWVTSDRSEDDMAVWEWRNIGIEREVDARCPHLDVLERNSRTMGY